MVPEVVGRDDELATVAFFLGDTEERPRALLLEGEAGIGKSTLWRAAVASALESGTAVLSCAPSEPESSLAFVALGDLVGPHADLLPSLPDTQRRSLMIALAMSEQEGPLARPRAIAAGFLSLIHRLGEERQVLIAVDDAQWLDADSALALGFATRRLQDEPVALLVAWRTPQAASAPIQLDRTFGDRLVRVPVGPLSMGALRRIVRARLDVVFPRQAMQRIHQASGGNALFALELARALHGRGGVIEPGRPLPVPQTLRAVVSERMEALPLRVRRSLACAAALAQPTVSTVGDPGALELGVKAGMIEIERGRVRFVHPLIASAAYESVGAVEQGRLHRRLAESADDAEEGARHLALAAPGPDAVVASTLEDAATRAAARGAPGSAAELAELARDLTPREDSEGGTRRAVDAGWYRFVAGDAERARALLEAARSAAPPGATRARATLRLAWLTHHAFDRRSALGLYREALAEASDDAHLQAQVHSLLAWCLLIMRGDIHEALRHAREAVERCEHLDDEVLLVDSLAIEAQTEFVLGGGLPSRAMERAMAIHPDTPDPRELRQPLQHWAVVLFWADRLDESHRLMSEVLERARAHGDESALAWPLMRLCHIELLTGNWPKAARYAEEGHAVAVETGQRPLEADMVCSRALVLSFQGRSDEARDVAKVGTELAERWGAGIGRRLADWGLGMLDLSMGRAEEAHDRLEGLRAESRANGIVDPGENRFVGDLGEAMVVTGRVAEAEGLSDELYALGTALERPFALAAALRVRGLALAAGGDAPSAIASFEEALGHLERTSMPFELARTLLVLGAARRRVGQRRLARQDLGTALATFEGLGAARWAANARTELGRIGGRASSSGGLTPTERRIAELVAEGKTNKEVAATLVVADRTVESALTQIYRKLDVRSRTELARKLPSLG